VGQSRVSRDFLSKDHRQDACPTGESLRPEGPGLTCKLEKTRNRIYEMG